MARTIINQVFEVRCKCDRCGKEHSRVSDGEISLPGGWSFLLASRYGSHREEGALLCEKCVAIVLVAAAPAQLQLKN
jgi:hypothetical protein